jgi:apolipoprotein N-acyltransferase
MVERAAIFALLCGGGLLTGLAVASPGFHWAAWIGLIPIFAAVRQFAGAPAILGGALWGIAVYVGAVAVSVSPIPMTYSGCAAYLILPAGYVYIMALFSRRYWYSSLAMALGWIVIELIVNASGVRPGLISAEHIDNPFFRVIADFLGTGFVAFVVAYLGAVVIIVSSYLSVNWGLASASMRRYASSRIMPDSRPQLSCGRRFRPIRPRGPPADWGTNRCKQACAA